MSFSKEQEEQLLVLYQQGKNDYDIAQLFHVGRTKLREWRNIHNIPSKTNKKGLEVHFESILKRKISGKSFSDIAHSYGVCKSSIKRLLLRNGYAYKPRNRSVPKWVSSFFLTPTQKSILIGDLFGDGHLHRTSIRGAYYFCAHSIEQEDFVLWKSILLSPLSNRIYYGNSEKDGPYISLSTWTCPELVSYQDKFYSKNGGDKKLPCDLVLDNSALALWYMGDGTLHRFREARITVGRKVDLNPVMTALEVQYEGLFRARRYENQWTIFMNDNERFFQIVGPFIIPAMQYKIPIGCLKYCTGSFPELQELRQKIDSEREGKIPFRKLLNS